ncbi:MAG: hypothetical protein ABL949_16060, partial [Fimbriimonadaceae bacterium]
ISPGPAGFEILAQEKRMIPSRVTVSGKEITCENVASMRVPAGYRVQGKQLQSFSTPVRGPIKEVMRDRMTFIFGTAGTPEENAWMLAKARYDAEQFWYRGNGGVKVLADTDAKSATGTRVLYGNSAINKLWSKNAPIKVESGSLKYSEKSANGSVGSIFWFSDKGRSVVCIGGTDLAGMKSTERLPLFVSGVGYPDWVVFKPSVVAEGYQGVIGAGYWSPDSNPGEFVWR